MSIEASLLAKIQADVPSAGKGYPLDVPQDAAPAWAYQTIDDEPVLAHNGPINFRKARVQITLIAVDYSTAKTLSTAVRTALDGFKGVMYGTQVEYCKTTISDDWADLHKLPVARLDVMINYKT